MRNSIRHLGLGALLGLATLAALAQAPAAPALKPVPAPRVAHASTAPLLASAWAGRRAVAVGEHGVVLLSDDGGASYRQAQAVPVSSTLTDVAFADGRRGWAVGHWGAVLHTEDGGEHWALQRLAADEDRPLFGVHFFDADHGVAVGLWSLVLTTADGGKTWQTQQVPAPAGASKADLNLLSLFADATGRLFATAERGQVLVSDDRGKGWRYLDTGYAGSLWAGTALPDGTLLVGGLRGSLYRSGDGGASWVRVDTHTRSSITGFVMSPEGPMAFGLDGALLLSRDEGRSFAPVPAGAAGRGALTAALERSGAPLFFSRTGVAGRKPSP